MRGVKWLKSTVAASFLGAALVSFCLPGLSAETKLWTLPADAVLEGPAANLAVPCTGPRDTPLCALKTYLACVLYDAPALCTDIGLEGITERHPGADTLDADILKTPWLFPFERIMPEAFALHIYDGGRLPASRFPTRAQGTYEILVDIPEPYVKDLVYTVSYFFGHDERGWRMTGWASSRAKACDDAVSAAWGPCKWFIRNLASRDVFAKDVTPLWASPTPLGRDDYPHPGLDMKFGLPSQPVPAPFDGLILRRALKYPDTPAYDWVVIQGEGRYAHLVQKMAFVDRTGASPGGKVKMADMLGKPQWVESEHPGAGRFVHIELLRDGVQVDPRTVMRERKQEPMP